MTRNFARLINIAAVALAGSVVLTAGGQANAASQVVARVDISRQRMVVTVDGRPAFEWKVSTAGKGYVTPTGSWKPTRMHKMWYSKKYDNALMPHSVFFTGGYAIHATSESSVLVRRLRMVASVSRRTTHPTSTSLCACSVRRTPRSSSWSEPWHNVFVRASTRP
jgi:hypothetical protein